VDNLSLAPKSPLEPFLIAGRYGAKSAIPGVKIKEKHSFSLASLTVFRGQYENLSDSIFKTFGTKLLKNSEISYSHDLQFMNIAPGQWFAYSERLSASELISKLETSVGELAAIVDLSDARAIIELSGTQIHETLAKGVSLDLYSERQSQKHVFSTFAAQLSITLWSSDDGLTINIAVFRAFSQSLLKWLVASASEFGCEIDI